MTRRTIEDRPVYKGLPVPWIALWSGDKVEVVSTPVLIDDEFSQYPMLTVKGVQRGYRGVLWQQHTETETGTPEFGAMNATRLLRAMNLILCQICGEPVYKWQIVMPAFELVSLAQTSTTTTPPCCDRCVAIAPTLCPALGKFGWVVVRARDARAVAAWGEFFMVGPDGKATSIHHEVPLDQPYTRALYGKQLTMALDRWQVVEQHLPAGPVT